MSKKPRSKNNANDAVLRDALAATPGATVSELAFDAGMSVSTARAILNTMAENGTATRAADPDAPRPLYRWTLTDTTAPDTDTTPAPPAPKGAGPASGRGRSGAAARARRTRTTTGTPPAPTDPAPASPDTDTTPTSPVPAGPATAPAGAAGTAAVATANTGDAAATAPVVEKLPSGALRGMVESHLRENPGQAFSPTALKHALELEHAPRTLSSGAINNALEKLTADKVAVRTSDTPKKWALAADA
ncbi:helix-turn-helix domain-containing protein [Nocardia sp. GAS34]|uniref:helix-turn-helix domain-containing protein n=1 Tax=unclassified Nocardia TaxID=2637762 RepID=UPI003D26374D